jgi:hypothetical protein
MKPSSFSGSEKLTYQQCADRMGLCEMENSILAELIMPQEVYVVVGFVSKIGNLCQLAGVHPPGHIF